MDKDKNENTGKEIVDEAAEEMARQNEKFIRTNRQPKIKPIMSVEKDKQYFDSLDYYKKKDEEREVDQQIQEAEYVEIQKMEQIQKDHPHNSHPLIKEDEKKGFDSAEYFMSKELEEKIRKQEEERKKAALNEIEEEK